LTTPKLHEGDFPFSLWAGLLRRSLKEEKSALLAPVHPQGDLGLRREIVRYLKEFRDMEAEPEQVVLGAGTEQLLGLLTELLPDAPFALENPTYPKALRALTGRKARIVPIPVDDCGLLTEKLFPTSARTVLTAPSHHFPLGAVMSVGRRRELLSWASEAPDRWIVEDDYDSELRYALRPIPPVNAMDRRERVVYLNSFTRTLAPSLRIAYLVLPGELLGRLRRSPHMSSPISSFEQSALRRFMEGGHYERHLNRLRHLYRGRRDAFLAALAPLGSEVLVKGREAGLHLTATAVNGLEESGLVERAALRGLKVFPLSRYFIERRAPSASAVLSYSGHDAKELAEAGALLAEAWRA
jgi:GntR family transcriptional regulator/MocR family aminotransferase